MDVVSFQLVDISFNMVFSDPYCRYTWCVGGVDFNQNHSKICNLEISIPPASMFVLGCNPHKPSTIVNNIY